MKELLLTTTYTVGLSELFLAAYFLKTHSDNEIRKIMSWLAFTTGIWVILSAATSYIDYSKLGFFLASLSYVFGLLLMTSILQLSIVFPYKIFNFDRLHHALLYLPVALISVILLTTHTILESYSGSSTFSGLIKLGPLGLFYNMYLLCLFVIAMIILIAKGLRSTGFLRNLIYTVIFSFLIGGLPSILQYLIFPVFLPQFYLNLLFGNICTILWVGITSYILIRK